MKNARARRRWSYGGLARSPAEAMRRLGAGLIAIASPAALVAPGAARAAVQERADPRITLTSSDTTAPATSQRTRA